MNSEMLTIVDQEPKKYNKILKGFVVSTKNAKTIVVKVEQKSKHFKYKKLVISHKKYHAHDEHEIAKVGDFVEIIETRPLSKLKNWRIRKIITQAK